MSDFDAYLTEDARLVILKALHLEADGRLHDNALVVALDTYGHRRSRDWVRTQLRKLADLQALHIREAGTVMVAEIRQAGVDHLELRGRIEGIAVPSRSS